MFCCETRERISIVDENYCITHIKRQLISGDNPYQVEKATTDFNTKVKLKQYLNRQLIRTKAFQNSILFAKPSSDNC